MQQLVKLYAAAELGADVLLLADSEVVFVRPVTAPTCRRDGRFGYYRGDNAAMISPSPASRCTCSERRGPASLRASAPGGDHADAR
jgi:hypothetical protein